jgi:hypothetical protein
LSYLSAQADAKAPLLVGGVFLLGERQGRQPTQAAPAAMMQQAAIRQLVKRSLRKAAPSKAANTTLVSRRADTAPIALACIVQIIAP